MKVVLEVAGMENPIYMVWSTTRSFKQPYHVIHGEQCGGMEHAHTYGSSTLGGNDLCT